jgi:2-iminobutanoate/2-iminopropanoate deaminase
METIYTEEAPRPSGHYSQALVHNGLIYAAGQLPIDPITGEKKPGSIEDQTQQALNNLTAVIRAAGGDVDTVLKVTVYVSDILQWDKVNAVFVRHFGGHRPARSVVPTRELHYGFEIEIDAIAAVTEQQEGNS